MTLAVEQFVKPVKSVESPTPHRFTREEYYRLGELGMFEGQRVELIEGEIVDMAPQLTPHAMATSLALQALQKAFPGYLVRIQMPLSFGASEPEPDLAIVTGQPRDYPTGHPQTALLVVEVSESTLRYDRTRKASLYARAGIKDYWVLNLVKNCLEVMRGPVEDGNAEFGWRYASVTTLKSGDLVSPLAKPQAVIAVTDLLP
ncbi:MAG: Uma2 family endonuclease [Phycisphaerales bacterium]|nr:Uma2 family endonuclease [Phycisphaerales bacterium]